MSQERLFYEDELDALKEAVRALGGMKAVGPLLHPEKSVDAAARHLSDALNPNRAERLTLAQVMLVMRRARDAGAHGPWQWINAEIGYEAKPVDPEDERARLQREFAQSVQMQKALIERMERLSGA